MKNKFLAAIALIIVTVANVNAQTDESRIKILPTNSPGVIKVLYAMEITEPVEVKFLVDGNVVVKDKIKGDYPNGILRKYNVRNISHRDFKIEISSPQITVTYRMKPLAAGEKFASVLEKTTYNHLLVKANN